MLDRHSSEQAIAAWIYALPCHVNFPANIRSNFERSGPSATVPEDVRSSVRIHCSGDSHRAAMELRQSCPALPREPAWHSVFTTNLSKSGCGFFHSEIVYPSERFSMILLTGIKRLIEVVWCRRIDAHCYAVGSRFCNQDEAAVAGGTP